MKALAEESQPIQIIAEQNSFGQPIIEQLSREGLPIQPFTTTNASKAQAIEALALALERGDIRILNDPVLGELVAYQAEKLPSGLLRYGAPSGQHDDTVMALAIAWSGVSMQHRLVYAIPDARIVVQEFTIPDHWPRAYGLDIRWNTVAVIWVLAIPSRTRCICSVNIMLKQMRPSMRRRSARAQTGLWDSSVPQQTVAIKAMDTG